MTEENENLNPQAEGSNTASKRVKLEEEDNFFLSDFHSDISSEYNSDSSEEEWLEKYSELEKLSSLWEELVKENENELIRFKKIKSERGSYEKFTDKEKIELEELKGKISQAREIEKEVKELQKELAIYFSDIEDESENEEENSLDKGKGKEVSKEVEAAQLETSLVSWINEGTEQEEAQIETKGVSKGAAAFFGIYTGGATGIIGGMITGASIGTATIPGIGTVGGAIIGTIVGICGGTAVGAGTAALIINADEKTIRAQTKKQLEEIVLTLTKSQQEQKTNLIRYLTIVKEKMDGQTEKIEKLESEKAGLIKRLGNANEQATELKGKLKEREEKLKEEKKKEQQEKEEQARLLGETQKALLSAEKSEIEQLRAERNQLRATSEEQEAFLSRWIRQYSRLELEKNEAAHLALKYGAEVREYRKDKEILTNQISRIEIEKGQLKNDIVGLQGNIKTKNIEIKNLTNSRDEARNEKDTAQEELGKFKLEKIQWVHDKKRLEEERDEAVRTMESLGYPKWFKRSTDFLGVESANQIWGKGVFIGRFVLLLLVGAFLFYLGSWILRILVGIFRNLKAIFTKKQDTATVLKEMLTGMKEAKDSMIKKVKRVKKIPVEEVKEVEVIEEISSEKTDPISEEKTELEKPAKKDKRKKKKNKKKVKGDSS